MRKLYLLWTQKDEYDDMSPHISRSPSRPPACRRAKRPNHPNRQQPTKYETPCRPMFRNPRTLAMPRPQMPQRKQSHNANKPQQGQLKYRLLNAFPKLLNRLAPPCLKLLASSSSSADCVMDDVSKPKRKTSKALASSPFIIPLQTQFFFGCLIYGQSLAKPGDAGSEDIPSRSLKLLPMLGVPSLAWPWSCDLRGESRAESGR